MSVDIKLPVVYIAPCVAASLLAVSAVAGTVTEPCPFRFDAEVTRVINSPNSPELRIAFEVGQVLSGRYYLGGNAQSQFRADRIVIEIGNELLTYDINFASAGIGVLGDGGPSVTIAQSISLNYLSPTDVFPGWGGSAFEMDSDAFITLVGSSQTLTEGGIIPDISDWNDFSLSRQLNLTLGHPESISIEATIGDFVLVPEPSANQLVLLAALAVLTLRSSFRGASRL